MFPPAQVEAVGQGTRCSRCLLDFPACRLVGLAKSDPGCQGDLFTLGPVPRQSPQVRDPAGVGTILRVKGLQIDPSHNLRHFAGALWCSKCGGIVNLVMPASKTGAPHLRAVCREVPSSKPYGRGLVQLAALDAPSHLKGGWPGASNLSLKGVVECTGGIAMRERQTMAPSSARFGTAGGGGPEPKHVQTRP